MSTDTTDNESDETVVTVDPRHESVMPPGDRALVHFYRGLGLTQAAIATRLDCSTGAVKHELNRTRNALEAADDPLDVWDEQVLGLLAAPPDGDTDEATEPRLVQACPACDSSQIYERVRTTPRWRCESCGETFAEPVERPRRRGGTAEPKYAPRDGGENA